MPVTAVTEKRIAKMISLVKETVVAGRLPASVSYKPVPGHGAGLSADTVTAAAADYPQGFMPFTEGMKWGEQPETHCWFSVSLEIPEEYSGSCLRFRADTSADGWNVYNPQFIAYIDGKAVWGFDANHRTMELAYAPSYEILLRGYTGSLAKNLGFNACVEVIDRDAEKLYYDFSVMYGTAVTLDSGSAEYAKLMSCLTEAVCLIDFRDTQSEAYRESVRKASVYIDTRFYGGMCGCHAPYVDCVGHTHIDVAWLWTLERTREKAAHTFSTVLALMEKYPELVFFSSQPQLLKFIRQDDPELFSRIKQKAAEGRIEFEGSMWVEADCNLTSGESLVRQIIHGKKFFRDEFGAENHILWLPDVFGYSASLPQICKKSGIDTFVTSKISWNDTNRMPHDIFNWTGIDGTRIFTYFLTAQDKVRGRESANYTTYVATSEPECVIGAYDRMTDKALTDEVLLTMGWGDGGGGPTMKMCEKASRLGRGLPGCPTVVQSGVDGFISRVKKSASAGRIPEWDGELYLEYHRGTYTSAAKNKKYNRFLEFAAANAEQYCVTAKCLKNAAYPADKLFSVWKTLLLNQFHDIIPGSSIPEVYAESRRQYEKAAAELESVTDDAVKALSSGASDAVFNPTFAKSGLAYDAETGSYTWFDSLPSAGFAPANGTAENSIEVSPKRISSRLYEITFGDDMSISSVYDRENRRRLCGSLGRFAVYEDIPFNYDCWNLEEYHTDKVYPVDNVTAVEEIRRGAGAGLKVTYSFMSSVIECEIVVFDKSRRIDYNVKADWREKNLILKAVCDADINNNDGVFDIQYGYVSRPANRNTSWEQAKFEVCGQKYADISDGGYGLALINDCKYGYSVRRGGISLSLLKASSYPNEFVDCDKHTFRFSLVPHKGGFREAGVIAEAAEFNNAPVIMGKTDKTFELVKCDRPEISLGAVKAAYDGNGIVIRLAESFNTAVDAVLELGIPVHGAYICDLEENNVTALEPDGNRLNVSFRPFEIVTVKIL